MPIIGVGVGIGFGGGPKMDPDALNWAARVVANGGTVSGSTLVAVSNFCTSVKNASLWASIVRINLFCGTGLAAALVPLKVGTGGATETNSGSFVAGDYAETGASGGLKGDGSGKYLNTGYSPSGLNVSSAHVAAYWKGIEAGGTSRQVIGTIDGSTAFTLGWASSGTKDVSTIASNLAYSPTPGTTARESYILGSVNGDRYLHYYVNGSEIATAVAQNGAQPTLNLYVGASNNNNSPGNFSLRYIRAYHVGTGLTSDNAATLNTIMQSFQTALSRNV